LGQNFSWRSAVVFGVGGVAAGIAFSKYFVKIPSETLGNPESLRKWAFVGRIKKLVIYPVKSCPGIEVDTAQVTALGLADGRKYKILIQIQQRRQSPCFISVSEFFRDRIFLIVDSNGDFKTLRQFPSLALVRLSVREDGIEFSAPDTTPFFLSSDLLRSGTLKTRSCRYNIVAIYFSAPKPGSKG